MSITTYTPTNPAIAPDTGSVGQCLAETFRGSLNAYVAAVEDKAQAIQGYAEQMSAYDGYGALTDGGTIAAGAGLSVTIGPYTAYVGNIVGNAGTGTVGSLGANATSTIYLYQDGTFDTTGTVTSHGPSMPWGQATTNASTVTAVSNIRRYHQRQYGGSAIPINAIGTTTLTVEQYARPAIAFSGTAVGTAVIILPSQAYATWDVWNAGTASLQMQAATGGSVVLSRLCGGRIMWDGTDMQEVAAGRYRWTDCGLPLVSCKLAGTADPGFDLYLGSVRAYAFDPGTAEQVLLHIQAPHDYVEGTDLLPHVHWTPKTTGTGVVGWGFEYTYASRGSSFPAVGTIYTNTPSPAAVGGTITAAKHYISSFASLPGSALTVSWMLLGRLFRDAPGTGTADTYTADAYGLAFDIHYLSDGRGSRTETTK